MILTVDPELRALAAEIVAWMATEPRWPEYEGADFFQTTTYAGGYEALEAAFTFSYYAADGREWWFQLTPDEVGAAADGRLTSVKARTPD